jgi:acyl carrier protein
MEGLMALSEPEILYGVAEIINEETGISMDVIRLESHFGADLKVDAAGLEAIARIADARFGMHIPAHDIATMDSVGDIVSYIQATQG